MMESLQAYNWPGNVRELENIIERAVVISSGRTLEMGDWLLKRDDQNEADEFVTLANVEKEYITEVLRSTRWRVSGEEGAAKILGLNPNTLFSRMKKLGINRPS
jgi:transcriptional regulator of acetoin/glycerol metabolism